MRSIENEPLKLAPYQRRLLGDGRSVLTPEAGESFEVPKQFQPLFDAAERGVSLYQLTEVVPESGSQTRFETLRRFLLLLADHDLLLNKNAQRLAESLAPESVWPESLASTELFSKSITVGRLNPSSTNSSLEIGAATGLFVLSAWSFTALPFAANLQAAQHLSGVQILAIYALCFCGSRSLYALICALVTYFSGFKAGLSLALEPSGPTLKVDTRGTPFSLLTTVCLILGLGSIALFAKLALSRTDAITAAWFSFFSILAFLVEANPFSKSSLTTLLKSAYSKSEDEVSVSRWHIVSSYAWTIVYSLTVVLVVMPALTSLLTLSKSASSLDKIAIMVIGFWTALIVISSLLDLLTSFSYDEKTGGSIRRLWSRKSTHGFEDVQSTQPSAQDLEKLPFLRQIEVSVRQKLVDLAKIKTFAEGQAICRQGSVDRSLFVVLEGRLAVAKAQKGTGGGQRRKIVAFLDPGAVFGESAFFFGRARTADVVAMESSRVLVIPHIDEMKDIDPAKSAELQARIWFLQALMQSQTFKELPSEALDAILVSGQRVVFPAGRRIIQEGEAGDACYFIVQGQASVTQNSVEINKMKTGDAFGEIAVLTPGKLRTATVTADSELIAIRIDASKFWHLLRSHLPLAIEIERLARARTLRDQQRAARKARARA